ncbi:MAG: hypothetical protein ABL876_10490 [Chitinophagaceae bacterium]
MTHDTITQFVCFITNLNFDDFIPAWEHFSKELKSKKNNPALLMQIAETKTKYRYISQHEWPEKDFHFSFMNEKKAEHFPDHNARVVQIGGYTLVENIKKQPKEEHTIKLLAFIGHNETDIAFYSALPGYHQLRIHQAYYESCMYGFVLQYSVSETNAPELLAQLKQRAGVELGIYKEALVQHA